MESYMRSPNCYVAAFLIIQDFAHILTGSIRSCIYVCVHRAAMRFDVCKYVNGKPAKAVDATGQIDYAEETELRIGCNHQEMKPSHIHREHGTLPGWFSPDGIVDEIKIHDRALNDEQVLNLFNDFKAENKPFIVFESGNKKPGKDFRVGYRHLVDSTNVIVWIKLKSSEPVKMKLSGR